MADRSSTPPGTFQYSECRPRAVVESFSVPPGVWRPPLTFEALGRTPLSKTCGPTPPASNVFHSVPQRNAAAQRSCTKLCAAKVKGW
jgi:hypothetical protein